LRSSGNNNVISAGVVSESSLRRSRSQAPLNSRSDQWFGNPFDQGRSILMAGTCDFDLSKQTTVNRKFTTLCGNNFSWIEK
jgi:hypothetical protein